MNTPKTKANTERAGCSTLGAAPGSDELTMEAWEAQGGDTDGILRTVCHECDRMFPMHSMTEDDRFDNICPSCIADHQNAK